MVIRVPHCSGSSSSAVWLPHSDCMEICETRLLAINMLLKVIGSEYEVAVALSGDLGGN